MEAKSGNCFHKNPNFFPKKGEKLFPLNRIFIKMCQNTPQLCWVDEWPILSPGGRGLG